MSIYSQGKEDAVICDYFRGYTGHLLDIGANDGVTLSNSRRLVKKGWGGLLVEPSPATFQKLYDRYFHNDLVFCLNAAISDYIGLADFYDSGSHLGTGDTSLLSTLHVYEKSRWKNTPTEFKMIKVRVIDFKKLIGLSTLKTFDFISIDTEGNDLLILRQMDLKALGCKCVCVEHNGSDHLLMKILEYCALFGFTKELLRNAENIVLGI